MSQGYQIINQSSIHYMTFQVVDWVDVFSKQRYQDIVLDGFRCSQKEKGLWLYLYVIQPNDKNNIKANGASTL